MSPMPRTNDDGRAHTTAPMEFEAWKLRLSKDCEAQGKLTAFNSLGDYALRLLWEQGIDPSVDGIVGSRKQNDSLR